MVSDKLERFPKSGVHQGHVFKLVLMHIPRFLLQEILIQVVWSGILGSVFKTSASDVLKKVISWTVF